MSNQVYKWRGPVQPAEAGATNLEVKLWRGPIEPTAPAVVSGLSFVDSLTKDLVRDLVGDLVI